MGTLQHVYRRGHLFWWRRVHRLFNGSRLDVRLSLKTADRLEARNRGATLTASTQRVLGMLNSHVQTQGGELTEQRLQAIAKSMYEERLSEICTDQRATPYHAEMHSAANRAFIDYFQRLANLGGHMSLLPAEERRLEAEGWDTQRVADLRGIVRLREDEDISPIRRAEIDRHLADAGFMPNDRLRWQVELALYRAYRDAYADAEAQLQSSAAPGAFREAAEPTGHPATSSAAVDGSAIPADWRDCSPTQAAERMISETPKLLEHRRSGKRAKETVGEQTLRQIRWAATLLEKSLPPGTPLWKITKQDIVELDRFFDQLPISFGKSIYDRDPAITLEAAAAAAAEKVDENDLLPDDIGLSTGTTNKHFNKLAQVHKFVRGKIPILPYIDFAEFTTAIGDDEREARKRYTREQGKAIFRLPPWTGCQGLKDRLTAGSTVFHDGLFFVLLLVWYTGARREELCKLMLDDVEERHGTAYLLIRPTETGRVKNKSARRVIVVADELIRLGLLRYVDAMRAAGETLLFPELMPGVGTTRKLGDVFYKVWWIYIKPLVPDLKRGQAMHSARHMVADELKDQEVFIEFRNDHLGHKGRGEGETRYPAAASLARLKELVSKIPVVTEHLPEQLTINLLPAAMRRPRPVRSPKTNEPDRNDARL